MVSFCVKLAVIQASCQGEEFLSGRHLDNFDEAVVVSPSTIAGRGQEFLTGRHLNNADGAEFSGECPTYALTSRRRRRPLSDPCPDGFTTIQNEADCELAQSCLGYKWQGTLDSTIDNADRQHACVWMRRGGGTVWFNPNVDDQVVHRKVQRLCISEDVPSTTPPTATSTAPSTVPSTGTSTVLPCDVSLDLAGLASPIVASLNRSMGQIPDGLSCVAAGNVAGPPGTPETVFHYDVEPGFEITLSLGDDYYDDDNYDTVHQMRWGGSCPGTNYVECTDEPDTKTHVWVNDQGQTERVHFIVSPFNPDEESDFTLTWSVQEYRTSCEDALDLAGLVSPINDTTAGRRDTLKNVYDAYGAPERVFYYDLAPGYSLTIGQTINNFDSTHVTRWGGECPGTNVVVWDDGKEGTDDGDDQAHVWINEQAQNERVYFVVDGYDGSASGEFTLAWSVQEVPLPRVNSCDAAVDLAGLVSPINDTTVGGVDSFQNHLGGAPERVFYYDLAPGYSLTIGQTINNFDSMHMTRWGGACPGTNMVAGTDDGDYEIHSWVNDQTQYERVFFIVDGYGENSGEFTLAWSVEEAQSTVPNDD